MKIAPREKKLIIAGAAALGLFLLIKLLIFPFYDSYVDQKKDIALKQKTKEKYLKFLDDQGKGKDALMVSGKEEANLQKSLLKGETPSLAAADIQKVIEGFAKESKIDVQSVKVMDPEQKENFTTIPVQVMFSSDLTRLRKFIQNIETDRKLLTIPDLKIRVKNEKKPQDITVTLQVAGFMKKGETKN